MLTVLAIALLVFLGLVALTWLGTMWAQGYFYDSAVDQLYWRAPAAAGAIGLFLLLWMVLDYSRPNTADTLFRFSSERADPFDKFISVRSNPGEEDQEIAFEKHRLPGGRTEFRDSKGSSWAPSKSGMTKEIILEENGERRRFKAPLSKDGKTFVRPEARGIQMPLRYQEENGPRFIIEDQMGKAIRTSGSSWVLNVFINLVHLAIWFVALWLVLRFQWPHALLGAVVCWLVLTAAVLPFMIDTAHNAKQKRAAPKVAALARTERNL